MISMNDSAVLLCGETRFWSLLGFEGLKLGKLGKLGTTIFTCNWPINSKLSFCKEQGKMMTHNIM